MAKTCTNEKTARRQEWIENGLLELMQQRRFEEITVTELCEMLSLSRRSFYRYFRDLEDVLDSALTHTFQRMALPGRQPELEELRANYEFWLGQRTLLDALHRSGMTEKLFEYTMRFAAPFVGENAPDASEKSDPLARETSLFAVCGSVALIISWYAGGFRESPEEMARIAYRILYTPLLESK